ncbi:DinB family protein [Kurthia senegalensis]|uniref:DinB family protein n=1 Tax=Kurthia senegalensis TaxID=1033740 RepID=UPI000289DB66|nr:DinB family protein [Kurthia senegalensis]
MYRQIEDFKQDWTQAMKGTMLAFEALTDEKLDFSIVEGHNSLGWLAWHLTNAPMFFVHQAAQMPLVPVGDPKVVPTEAAIIVEGYKNIANQILQAADKLTDEDLLEEVPFIQGTAKRGAILRAVIDHQTHHRGQMTVLLRQAGLTVPPVMGPTKEMSK